MATGTVKWFNDAKGTALSSRTQIPDTEHALSFLLQFEQGDLKRLVAAIRERLER